MEFPITTPSNSKIPRTLSSSPEIFLKQKISAKYHFKEMKAEEITLMKYYPKYYRRLYTDPTFRKGPVISKVKQVKTIQNFRYEIGENDLKKEKIYKLIKNTLQTKRKSILYPDVVYLPSAENSGCLVPEMEICRLFPRIKSLSADIIKSEGHTGHPLRLFKLHQHFWYALRSLKNFHLSVYPNGLWQLFLKKIQSAQAFLPSLETFSLRLSFNPRENNPEDTFKFLLGYQEVLKYVTHIDFDVHTNASYRGDQIKQIVENCPKLLGISFPVRRDSYFKELNLWLYNPQGKKSTQGLSALRSLVNNTWHLIENFESPPCLENLTIDFYFPIWDDKWSCLSSDIQNAKYRILGSFFGKFKQLTRLRSLNITTSQFTHPNDIVIKFLLPLLTSIPQLEVFECYFDMHGYNSDSSPLNLAILLNGVAPLKQLKSFKIFRHRQELFHNNRDLTVTFDPEKNFVLPNISCMDIGAWISLDFDFKQFLKSLPSSQEKRQINLSKINIYSIELFTKLLADFNVIRQSNSLKINLNVILHLDNLQDVPEALKYPLILPDNLTVSLKIYFSSSEYLPLPPKEVIFFQNIFRSLNFDIILKHRTPSQRRFSPNDIEIRHILLIENNLEQPIKDLTQIQPTEYERGQNTRLSLYTR